MTDVNTPGEIQPQEKKNLSGERPFDHQHQDEILDKALEDTFPASDPIELNIR